MSDFIRISSPFCSITDMGHGKLSSLLSGHQLKTRPDKFPPLPTQSENFVLWVNLRELETSLIDMHVKVSGFSMSTFEVIAVICKVMIEIDNLAELF